MSVCAWVSVRIYRWCHVKEVFALCVSFRTKSGQTRRTSLDFNLLSSGGVPPFCTLYKKRLCAPLLWNDTSRLQSPPLISQTSTDHVSSSKLLWLLRMPVKKTLLCQTDVAVFDECANKLIPSSVSRCMPALFQMFYSPSLGLPPFHMHKQISVASSQYFYQIVSASLKKICLK